jgi:hypothetical protein
MKFIRSGALALSITPGVGAFSTGSAVALPLAPVAGGSAITSQLDEAAPLIQVRYYGRRGGNGGAVAAGIIGGVILGGIIASQRPYYYNARPAYPVYGPAPYVGDAVGYCLRRFRSYDPVSMTYVGYDGYRHPCP